MNLQNQARGYGDGAASITQIEAFAARFSIFANECDLLEHSFADLKEIRATCFH